jgi:hypothetical protein
MRLPRLLAVLLLFLLPMGCGRNPEGSASTPVVYPALSVANYEGVYSTCGDTAYAQVDSRWLGGFYDRFRSEIFRLGVTKWDPRFDCNHFASFYVALAQTEFYLQNFHSATKAQTLALGVVWYQSPGGAHAIVSALTERGRVFIEPQTGAEVFLTPEQLGSIRLSLF